MLEQNGYGNIPIFSPDGILMFYTSMRKLRSYFKNNLVEKYKKGYKLNFIPKGLGYHDKENKDLLKYPRKNRCVISGCEDIHLLTRHHIVPVLFRRWMPEKFKSTNYQLIVFVKKDLHAIYTKYEQQYYFELAKMYDVKEYEETLLIQQTSYIRKKQSAKTLLEHSHSIPEDRLKVLHSKFKYYTGLNPCFENYKKVLDDFKATKKTYYKNADYNFGKLIVRQITDFEKFENMWLKHFIETMKPLFMPEDLKAKCELLHL